MTDYKNIIQNDREIRTKISAGRNDDFRNEWALEDYIISHSDLFPILKEYPYLYKREYLVNPPFENYGRGDLIFTDGHNRFLIVEVKYLNPRSGKTAKAKRRRQRQHVKEQALRYAQIFQQQNPDAIVKYATILDLDMEIFDL